MIHRCVCIPLLINIHVLEHLSFLFLISKDCLWPQTCHIFLALWYYVKVTWNNLTKGVPQGSILGPVLFNVFMNDLFYFIKKCSLYNYADDNSMSNASAKIDEVMLNLKLDSKIAITWFIDNGMEPHPEKFQFMVMSNNVIDTHTLELDDTTRLRSQSDVVLLGIEIDDKLTFAKHVSAICTKASKQLNAFTRISKFLSYDSKKLVINSFISSNFQYSPLTCYLMRQ